MRTWKLGPDRAWKLYLAALTGLPELGEEMRKFGMSDGDDLAEDASNLRPVLLREVSAAWRGKDD